jgi:hypothetical protein
MGRVKKIKQQEIEQEEEIKMNSSLPINEWRERKYGG